MSKKAQVATLGLVLEPASRPARSPFWVYRALRSPKMESAAPAAVNRHSANAAR
jgi:hypothetical protein